MSLLIPFLIATALTVVTVLADVFIKHASLQTAFDGWRTLLLGVLIYGLTGFGWFFVMRKVKLSTLGVFYSVTCVLLLTMVSIFYFKEKISPIEIVGIALAVISLAILARFA